MKKRNILFNLLVFGILILGLHINANAQETSVPDGYTGIYNIADLSGIRNNPSGKYILMNDIDMTEDTKKGGDWDSGMGWTPIEEFSGVLDGNGHKIIGMNIYTNTDSNTERLLAVGLFAELNNGIVENLGLKDVRINVKAKYVGSIVGYVNGDEDYDEEESGNKDITLIKNCYSSGTIQNTGGEYSRTGGLIGRIEYATKVAQVENCINMVNVSEKGSYSNTSEASGVVGGCWWWSDGDILCKNCYSIGQVSIDNKNNANGIVWADCDNCFYLKGSSSNEYSNIRNGIKVLTASQMKYAQTFTGFDFKNTWEIDPYCSYPYPQLKNNRYVRVKSLRLLSNPDKTVYQQGEKLDLSGATVRIGYEDGTDADIIVSDDMVASYDMSKLGMQTVTIQRGDKKVYFTIEIKEAPVTDIKLDKSQVDLKKGGTCQLNVTIYPSNATNKTVSWRSSDNSIATVTDSGNVVAKKGGTTTIWATSVNGVSASCVINVKVPIVSLEIRQYEVTIKVGETKKLKVDYSPLDATDELEWGTRYPNIVRVDNEGRITGLKAGEAKVFVKIKNNSSAWQLMRGCDIIVVNPTKPSNSKNKKVILSKTAIKKVSTLKKKKALIKYKKVKGASNYQVQYSMKKNFAGAKTKTAKGTSLKVSGLKVKKKYYFRVRVCKKVNGKTYYSGWSNVKSVKAKK